MFTRVLGRRDAADAADAAARPPGIGHDIVDSVLVRLAGVLKSSATLEPLLARRALSIGALFARCRITVATVGAGLKAVAIGGAEADDEKDEYVSYGAVECRVTSAGGGIEAARMTFEEDKELSGEDEEDLS